MENINGLNTVADLFKRTNRNVRQEYNEINTFTITN